MPKNNNSMQNLQDTVSRKEFWVGLATTVIVLLVAFKLIPWNRMPKLTTNKAVTTRMLYPTRSNKTATNGAMMNQDQMSATSEASTATSSAEMNQGSMSSQKVDTLADTSGGYYTVQNGDNYYKISVKVCGTGKYFESIQAQNNFAALYAGDQVVVTCAE
jgi:hypothetical protein